MTPRYVPHFISPIIQLLLPDAQPACSVQTELLDSHLLAANTQTSTSIPQPESNLLITSGEWVFELLASLWNSACEMMIDFKHHKVAQVSGQSLSIQESTHTAQSKAGI